MGWLTPISLNFNIFYCCAWLHRYFPSSVCVCMIVFPTRLTSFVGCVISILYILFPYDWMRVNRATHLHVVAACLFDTSDRYHSFVLYITGIHGWMFVRANLKLSCDCVRVACRSSNNPSPVPISACWPRSSSNSSSHSSRSPGARRKRRASSSSRQRCV